MNQSLCMLLINFSSPRLQDLQQTGMGEASAFFEQVYQSQDDFINYGTLGNSSH